MSAGAISLNGQVALVTGARRGLGRVYALELAARGASVVVNGTTGSAGLEDVVEEIRAAGGTAAASRRNVDTREGGEGAVQDAIDAFGRLDIVINNAGILRAGMFEDLNDADLDALLNIHIKSLFYVCQPALAIMRKQGYGRIVTTGSNTEFGMRGLASYAAAKGGVMSFTKCLGMEGADDGVLVNCVMPNAATPAMENDPIPGFENDTRFAAAFEATADRFDTAMVAPLVVYLASRECVSNGESYSALGGRYARVFYGVTDGWLAPPGPISADDIASNAEQILQAEPHRIVGSILDEYEAVAQQVSQSVHSHS
jgi:NAD(P)-dependent dehydrogenase (short-subunit alcohol dehydrogenase family)